MVKKHLNYLIILIILIGIFLFSNVMVSLIPSEKIRDNVRTSAEQLCYLGEKRFFNNRTLNFYFTDILMVNIAYSIDNTHPFESSILTKKNYQKDVTKKISVIEKDVEADSDYSNIYNGTAIELLDFVNNKVDESFEYARYWHGYLVFLRPFLLFLNYGQIVFIFYVFTASLIIALAIILFKKKKKFIFFAFLISVFLTDMHISALCLNENICLIIALIFSIYLLQRKDKMKNIGLSFFAVGMITNFLDFLTFPVITLAFPLVFYFVSKDEETNHLKQNIKKLFLLCIAWAIGYMICWMSKWLIADIFFDKEILKNALHQVLYRSLGEKITLGNLFIFISQSLNIVYIMCLFICVLLVVLYSKKVNFIYVCIALIPIIWLMVLKNHSAIHSFFTYKNLSVTLFALIVSTEPVLSKKRKPK